VLLPGAAAAPPGAAPAAVAPLYPVLWSAGSQPHPAAPQSQRSP
jgi:hypothetical protein